MGVSAVPNPSVFGWIAPVGCFKTSRAAFLFRRYGADFLDGLDANLAADGSCIREHDEKGVWGGRQPGQAFRIEYRVTVRTRRL